jgi:hypothetical protein
MTHAEIEGAVIADIDVAIERLRRIRRLFRTRRYSKSLMDRAQAWSSEMVKAVECAQDELDGRQRPALYIIRNGA